MTSLKTLKIFAFIAVMFSAKKAYSFESACEEFAKIAETTATLRDSGYTIDEVKLRMVNAGIPFKLADSVLGSVFKDMVGFVPSAIHWAHYEFCLSNLGVLSDY